MEIIGVDPAGFARSGVDRVPDRPSGARVTILGMDWKTEALPLLGAVARAIDANGGEHVNAEMVNAQLGEPLAADRLDRRLGELLKGNLIEGPTVEQRAAPVFISVTVRGREQVSGWPGQGHGSGDVSISGSTIGNLAFRDINISTVDVASFFDAWEQKIEELDVPEDHKREALNKLGVAKEVVTGAAGSAGGRALYDAFSLLFG